MRCSILCLVVIVLPCLFGQEIVPARGDLNHDGVEDATDSVLLINFQAGNLDSLYEAGDFFQVDSIVGVLRYVPAGTFLQGFRAPDPCADPPPFTHTLTAELAVMQTEVTRAMWVALKARQASLPADPTNETYGAGMDNPVQTVTWYESVLFANLLSTEQGFSCCYYTDSSFTIPLDATNYETDEICCDWSADGYRLPTEGEWEYFCRAGTTTPFSVDEPDFTICMGYCNSDDLPALNSVAWYCANQHNPAGNNTTKPAGLKNANPWGLADVHGNVWEWCWDWYGSYPSASETDFRGTDSGMERVVRGGSWSGYAFECRAAHRYVCLPAGSAQMFGFRLCRRVN